MKQFLVNIGSWILRHPVWFFVLWSGWMALEYMGLGDMSYLYIHDSADQEIPVCSWLSTSWGQLANARLLPELCGVDRLATTAWINGYRMLVVLFPDWLAHGLFVFLQRFVAGYFLFRWLREAFRCSLGAALLAGMAYTMVHFEYGEMRIMHDFNEPGLPLLLWGFWRLSFERPGVGCLQALGLGLLFTLGMDAVGAMPFFITGAGLVTLILRPEARTRTGFGFLVAFAVLFVVGVALPRLPNFIAISANLEFGHRTGWIRQPFFWAHFGSLLKGRVFELIQWWAVAPAIALWVFSGKPRDRRDGAIVGLLVMSLVLGSFLYAFMKEFDDYVGFLGGYNFNRYDRWLPLALWTVAALGLTRLQRSGLTLRLGGKHDAAAKYAVAPLLLTAGFALMLSHSWGIKQGHWADMRQRAQHWRSCYENPEVLALAEQVAGTPVRVSTAAAYHGQHPNYLMPSGLEQADGYVVLYPDHYKQYWSQVIGPLIEREPYFYGHFNNWGSRAYLFHARGEGEEHRSPWLMAENYCMPLLSLANVGFFVSRKPLDHPQLELVPRVAGEDARVAWEARGGKEKLEGFLAGENPGIPMYVYENTEVLPRWFLVGDVEIFDPPTETARPGYPWRGDELLYAALSEYDESAFREHVLMMASDTEGLSELNGAGEGSVVVDSYSLENSSLTVTSVGTNILVHSAVWYPWWTCTIDGKPATVRRANGAFMAVEVPDGEHKILWKYDPPY